jgi:hypothetical protein
MMRVVASSPAIFPLRGVELVKPSTCLQKGFLRPFDQFDQDFGGARPCNFRVHTLPVFNR